MIAPLPPRKVNRSPHGGDSPRVIAESLYWKDNETIKYDLLEFFGCWSDGLYFRAPEDIEVYGYYADYDWVLFCSLFGRMIDLPKGFPMYCRDLKQMLDESFPLNKEGVDYLNTEMEVNKKYPTVSFIRHVMHDDKIKEHPDYPKQDNEHNALADAQWNKKLYEFIQKI